MDRTRLRGESPVQFHQHTSPGDTAPVAGISSTCWNTGGYICTIRRTHTAPSYPECHMRRRKLLLGAVLGVVVGLGLLKTRDGSTQEITTCQAIGCHGAPLNWCSYYYVHSQAVDCFCTICR
jgi:hypothetical protein